MHSSAAVVRSRGCAITTTTHLQNFPSSQSEALVPSVLVCSELVAESGGSVRLRLSFPFGEIILAVAVSVVFWLEPFLGGLCVHHKVESGQDVTAAMVRARATAARAPEGLTAGLGWGLPAGCSGSRVWLDYLSFLCPRAPARDEGVSRASVFVQDTFSLCPRPTGTPRWALEQLQDGRAAIRPPPHS